MFINQSLFTLFRRVSPEVVINFWLESDMGMNLTAISAASYKNPDEAGFKNAMRNDFMQFTPDENNNIYHATRQLLDSDCPFKDSGVFGLLSYAVDDIFILDRWHECLCKFLRLIQFRKLSHPIGQELFVAAYLASEDIKDNYERRIFSFPPVVRTDNIQLHRILDRGMAENHFHIGGSVSSFLYAWICLMNHVSIRREREFQRAALDTKPLDQSSSGRAGYTESFYTLVFKAACIRYFLFLRLRDLYPMCNLSKKKSEDSKKDKTEDLARGARNWLRDRLEASNGNIAFYLNDLEEQLQSCRQLFCNEYNDGIFVPDYAIAGEPLLSMDDDDIHASPNTAVRNYERRVYRSIAGEQKFLYSIFRAIYERDSRIMPYADLAYAYLLIYCKLRSELIQTNRTVGFSNFKDYQDRKEDFTWNYPQYTYLRNRIAQQSVLVNPQIRTLEGRMMPSNTTQDLVRKICDSYKAAGDTESYYSPNQAEHVRDCANKKLHYVLHFGKSPQPIRAASETGDLFESTHCRNSMLRENALRQANAIIEARSTNPCFDIEGQSFWPMTRVTGIDACSNEIGCRPEVFAPVFRKIRCQKESIERRLLAEGTDILPNIQITYHAGEDFLDITDGLRAIDETICFLELQRGDRLGHALALGIDAEEWYSYKEHMIILPKQDLLDNMVWIYDKMHEYNIYNRSAEDEIDSVFNRYYNELVLEGFRTNSSLQAVTIDTYRGAMKLRGNEPMLYSSVPLAEENWERNYNKFLQTIGEAAALEPWRVLKGTENTLNRTMNMLYHCYHFQPYTKRKGQEQVSYQVPYVLIQVIQEIQKKMRHQISSWDIGIETNPSSNYLIGTFRNYNKHPLLVFNDKGLYDDAKNPRLLASINTDDLGVFDTSLENEYALMACALICHNDYTDTDARIPPEKIYDWLDHIRQIGCDQSFKNNYK